VNGKDDTETKDSVWQKTPYANLVRYKPSEVYFARLRVKGKLIRRSLKTNSITVAKLRLADLEKSEQQKAQSTLAVANGKMTFADALAVFQARIKANPDLKPRTKEYCAFRISALLKSWPGLAEKDVSRITNAECLDWSVKNASRNSSSSHNYTVSILRRVFDIANETGARYDNPAISAKRVKQRTKKQIVLPPGTTGQQLRTFEVLKPFEVHSGKVAPAFNQPGLGIQHMAPVKLETLLKRKIIREITH